MSPAGYWPQLQAAIEAGADAVYFGLRHFTARAKAGFGLDELPEAIRTLHRRGVRGFITFNTLVFEHEFREAAKAVEAIAQAGADAMILQDYGVLRLVREIAPGMELHASTQMTITDAAGVRLARSLGVHRVTLARELSLDEIRSIIRETGCEVEVFVHGALCVAYSGQCLSSEAWGGRSANRGQCAQACRLPYEMVVDGRPRPLGEARYLLSPGDLFALEQVPEMVDAGVAAMKIEGRYKDAEYVALVTRAYRKAVDDAWAGRSAPVGAEQKLQLEQVYSRGLGAFFLTGTNHQAVVRGRAPRHRGVLIGRVARVERDGIVVEPAEANGIAPLKPGDGVVFDAADWRSPEEPEEGGRVYQAEPGLDGTVQLRFANNAVRSARIRPGDLVWRTHDPEVDRAARPYLQPVAPVARQAVAVRVTASEGAPLVTEWEIKAAGVSVTVVSREALAAAQNRGCTVEAVRDQLGRLGGTPYELADVVVETQGHPFVPAAVLNRLRRQAVELLQAAQAAVPAAAIQDGARALERLRRPPRPAAAGAPELHLLVRTPEQLESALAAQPASITLDYLDLYGLRPSVERVKAAGTAVRVAAPRVLKPGEARILNFLLSLECPLVVRSAGLLEALRGQPHPPLIGDFSLNAANAITAGMYFELGVERLTPAHDLNAEQIAELAAAVGGDRVEAVAYHHLPVFHTEHCVFCRFLSTGTTFRDCGRPCEKHRAGLRDGAGRIHPVMADAGCRNTVFGGEAQSAAAHLERWRRSGIVHYRLEFVHESPEQVAGIARAFGWYFAGRWDGAKLKGELRRLAPEGTAEGSLYVAEGYRTLPVLP